MLRNDTKRWRNQLIDAKFFWSIHQWEVCDYEVKAWDERREYREWTIDRNDKFYSDLDWLKGIHLIYIQYLLSIEHPIQ